MRILILGLMLTSFASQAEEVETWLDKMSQAMKNTNFEGTMIIRQADQLQALNVRHGMNKDGLWERLESLNGEAREIIRHNSKVTTIFPQRKLVTVSHESAPISLHSRLPADMNVLKKLYHVKAEVLIALPADRRVYLSCYPRTNIAMVINSGWKRTQIFY